MQNDQRIAKISPLLQHVVINLTTLWRMDENVTARQSSPISLFLFLSALHNITAGWRLCVGLQGTPCTSISDKTVILFFCRPNNRKIRKQTTWLEQTFTNTIDKQKKTCLNFELTTEVHLFLVLTVSIQNDCMSGFEQARELYSPQF